MKEFIVRIELHNSKSSEDYASLHAEMEKNDHFSRYIEGVDSKTYHLPKAEYYRHGIDTETTHTVLKLAYEAVERVKKTTASSSPRLEGRFMVIEVAVSSSPILILNLEEKLK